MGEVQFVLSSIASVSVEIPLSGGFYEWAVADVLPPAAIITSTILQLVLIPYTIGITWVFLNLTRNETFAFEESFKIYTDFKRSLKLIGTSIIVGIFTFLWSLLFLIPGIIKSFSYSQTFYILRDKPELTILEAITESREKMNGLKGKFFLLNLSFIGWGLLSILTLGIGFLWLIPYMYASYAVFYNEFISDKPKESVVDPVEQ